MRSRRTVYLDLLGTCNGTKNNFCKPSMIKRTIRDPSHNLKGSFDNGHAQMIAIVDEACYVLSGHFR